CVTGLTIRHVGERFQRANETISKYFKEMLNAFSSDPFYSSQVRMPQVTDPIPNEIYHDPRRYPFFKDAIGALDGTHINAFSTPENRFAARNRK
ncbi:hypothetical protein BD779DRAFT_1415937, partial [Infundibulicybe gibba]